ncbi:transposase [Bradyrhizobium arachidis]|uniref:transposase n=1 Tax=Bradyrhizobium TaxID=374 RepID=UPI000A066612
MEGRQLRSFTDDYKRQAVDLVASSGRSIGSVAKELCLRDSVLRRWVEQRGSGWSRRRRCGAPHRRRRCRRRTTRQRSRVCSERTSGCAWSGNILRCKRWPLLAAFLMSTGRLRWADSKTWSASAWSVPVSARPQTP